MFKMGVSSSIKPRVAAFPPRMSPLAVDVMMARLPRLGINGKTTNAKTKTPQSAMPKKEVMG